MSKTCLACNKKLANKYTLVRHSKICKSFDNINEQDTNLINYDKLYDEKIKILEDKLNIKIEKLAIDFKKHLNDKDIEILDLKKKMSYILLNMPNNKNKD